MESTPSNGKTDQEWKVIRLSGKILPFGIRSSVLTTELACNPVVFAKEHKAMLAHSKELLEYLNGYISIHPNFSKLITSFRTAGENGEGVLDDESTRQNDVSDSLDCL
jgi:hypothetical protein